ncbi:MULTISPECIES: glycosyltransferase family 4 protein [unclassified Sinorhizobium]|uniref:glycosyltransferase family 4 protein n=1 Tax=unclassified Sinorhizobium TaxID=2613772 RepID=UPI003523D9E1
MRIAFYAPLKSPYNPVPSGDRLMARLLMRALEIAGHTVEVASEFRNFAGTPQALADLATAANGELERLRHRWTHEPPPDLWFCYHPYYKSPDPFGPRISAELNIPYVTAEASYSKRRNQIGWSASQALVAQAVHRAAVNICFTERDLDGLRENVPQARYARLKPFIDTEAFAKISPNPRPSRLMTVAMMRSGDKFESYRMLAAALRLIPDRPWTLSLIGDGPMRNEVRALFTALDPGRIEWLGERSAAEIASLLSQGGIYVWPGCGEAYGLAYLEAQAAGLPVVAQATAGVPEVVEADMTGVLTPDGDVGAYAAAIGALLDEPARRDAMGRAARRFVLGERSLVDAAKKLDRILREHMDFRYGE